MTRSNIIDPAVLLPDGVKTDMFIKYENLAARPRLGPKCMVTSVFPNGSEILTMDAARLRENSWFIKECTQAECFNASELGRRISMGKMTHEDFQKYMDWVKHLRLSRTNLAKPPACPTVRHEIYFRQHRDCLVMDRLVHWWLLGETMKDAGLMAAAMELINKYAQEGYELPLQSFERGWERSEHGSELRLWIFNMLVNTFNLPALVERGDHMPRDLATKLFVWFVEDKAGENALA